MQTFSAVKKFILDILFPVYCFGCGAEGEFLCGQCADKILFLYPACPVCKNKNQDGRPCKGACRKKTNLSRFLAAVPYGDPLVGELIKSFKYGFVAEIGETLNLLIIHFLELHQIKTINKKGEPRFFKKKLENFLLAPIPLHKKRKNWRGFNQAEILAGLLGENLKINVSSGNLVRSKNTIPQVEIQTRENRLKNIVGAFEIKNAEEFKNKNVILIDDVSTTGATLEECARVLRSAGAKQVYAITAARG